jgi:hypothetical protein
MTVALKEFTSPLMQFLPMLMGEKQNTLQTVTGDTNPLQSVFRTASQPMSMEAYNALIANIFDTASAQVPELTSALANAAGTRSSNNSPLALALDQQRQRAGTAAADKILSYNQRGNEIAAQAARGIADTTRGVTTTQVKGSATNPLLPILAGWGLNQFDKLGGSKKVADAVGSVFNPVNSSAFQMPVSLMGPAMTDSFGNFAPMGVSGPGDFIDLQAPADFFFPTSSAADALGSFAGISNGVYDAVSNIGSGVYDAVSNVGSSVFDGLSSLFSSWFADGGTIRNRNYMGNPETRMGVNALNREDFAGAGPGGNAVTSDFLTKLLASNYVAPGLNTFATERADGVGQSTAVGGLGTPGQNSAAMNAFGLAALSMAVPALAPAIAIAQALSQTPSVSTLAMQQLMEAVSESIGGIGTGDASNNADGLEGATPDGTVSVEGMSPDSPGDAGTGTSDGIGIGDASSSDGSGVGGDSYANGGMIYGPGTGVSDSILATSRTPGESPVRFSAGEVIIPRDTVETFGEQFFLDLIKKTHKPVRR